MKWALYGERLGVCIFDLDITKKYLIKALNFLEHMSYSGGMFLFVTTHMSTMLLVEEMAERVGHFSHTRKWEKGILSNSTHLFEAPIRIPDAIIFLNVMTSTLIPHPGIFEAARMTIPTIAVVDSNTDIEYVTYPIPGNDDSVSSVQYYIDVFEKAIETGRKRRNIGEETMKISGPTL